MPGVPSLTHHPSPVTHHSDERTLEGSHHVLFDLGRHHRPASLAAAAAAAEGRTATTKRRASCLTAAKAAAATATKGRAAKGRSTAFTFAFTASAFTFALAFATAFATTASSTAEDRTTAAAASTTEDRTTTAASSTTEDRTTLSTAAKDGHANPRASASAEQRHATTPRRTPRAQGEALQRTTVSHVTSESTQSEDSKLKRYACTLKCLTQPRRPVAFSSRSSPLSSCRRGSSDEHVCMRRGAIVRKFQAPQTQLGIRNNTNNTLPKTYAVRIPAVLPSRIARAPWAVSRYSGRAAEPFHSVPRETEATQRPASQGLKATSRGLAAAISARVREQTITVSGASVEIARSVWHCLRHGKQRASSATPVGAPWTRHAQASLLAEGALLYCTR